MKKQTNWSPFSNPSNSLRLNRIKRMAHSLKLINSYNDDSCAVAAVFNTLYADIIHDLGWKNSIWHLEFAAAENKGLLGRACFNVPSPLCVPAWAPWTCWCSRTDISYHRLMLPRRRSPPETSGTYCPFPCPRRNCCRCYSLERNNEMSNTNCLGLCSLLSGIIVDARNVCDSVSPCVFLLGSGPKQTSKSPSWSSSTPLLSTSTQNEFYTRSPLWGHNTHDRFLFRCEWFPIFTFQC